MKTKFILLLFLGFLFSCGDKNTAPAPQVAATTEEKPAPVDTTGSQKLPVMIAVIKQIDSIPGFAVAKAVINEKTLQAELRVIEYLDATGNPLAKETRVIGATKR